MKAIYFFTDKSFVTLKEEQSQWRLIEQKVDQEFVSFAFDTLANRMYAGSFDDGLWLSEDEGKNWTRLAEDILPDRVMSLAISPHENNGDYQVLWLGSEPSALYRSEDGGHSWGNYPALLDLPSESSWSFPPRPDTHHVRTIQVDLHDTERIFVGIELGGVMKSEDKGLSWQDRHPDSQFDVHSLTMVHTAVGRIYEAAGGGFAQSKDSGRNWETDNQGLGENTYLVNIAVNEAASDTIIASASKGARYAYNPARAESVLVRKEDDKPWEVIKDGLPEAEGSAAFHLLSDPNKANHFYALNNRGLFQSKDSGLSWAKLDLDWPDRLSENRIYACQLFES